MVLGASRAGIVGMVLRSACAMVSLELILGSLGAWYLYAAAESFLFRVHTSDPRVFAAVLAVLSLAALVSSVIPARRAASGNPLVALRVE